MTPAEVLDEVLAAVTPVLEQAGYRKSARNFVAQSDGVARIVQVQTSQLKKPEQATFTLGVLVTSVAFHEAYAGTPFPKNAGSAEPVVQAGLGRLMPDGEDVAWSLTPGVSAKLISNEVVSLLKEHILPFLARFPSEDTLLAELEDGDALPGFNAMRQRCRAVLLAKRGKKDAASEALRGLLAANAGEGLEGFRDSVNALASRIGVKL